MSKQFKLLMVTLALVATLGCGLLSKADLNQPEEENIPAHNDIDFGGINEWPAYLPPEIPVLQGEIRLVMGAPDAKVRIFYEPLSDQQIEQYLELCQENGFEVAYQIYTREGFPDQSAEKQKAGDYDAVVITKDHYRMRLEYGEDTATLDIEILGQ